MDFEIPSNLGVYTVAALNEMRTSARTSYNSLLASVSAPEAVATDEQIADLEKALAFDAAVDAEITARATRAAKLADLKPLDPAPVAEPVAEVAPVTEPVAEPVAEVAPVTAAVTVSIADISGGVTEAAKGAARVSTMTLLAAADVPGYPSSSPLANMEDVGKAFMARTQGYNALRGGDGRTEHGVATFVREYPKELTVFGDDRDATAIAYAIDQSRLPGGSLIAASTVTEADVRAGKFLTAAVAWCAPSQVDYDVCMQITTDGIASFPEVLAPRGGIRHNTGIDFSTLFGDGTGYFNYSESQIISGVTKGCLTIGCPSFVDTRLGVTGLCITGNILQNRAYPEYVTKVVTGSLAASAHQINMLQIAAVVAGSDAVDLTATVEAAGDGTVVSQLFAAIDLAITDIKYRLRLLQNGASLEVKLPFWVLAAMRADWSRRNAVPNANLADAEISAWFATRDAAPDFVYDWQDAFSNSGVGPGQTAAITALPTTVSFLVYPAGTWVRAVSDVITLNSVYDSTKLATNQVTQLFTEQGWAMAKMCPLSRVYTVGICPSGETGAQRTSTTTFACS